MEVSGVTYALQSTCREMGIPTEDLELHRAAGAQRLAATILLGGERIEVVQLGDLTPQQLRVLELEENVRRKDLTQYEKSKIMVEYIETVKEEMEEERFLGKVPKNPLGGRPQEPTAEDKVEKHTGISRRTAHRAEAHVDTADSFPFMQSWPQYRVLEAHEWFKQLPEEEHQLVANILSQPAIPSRQAVEILQNMSGKPQEERQEIYKLDRGDEQERTLAQPAPSPP